MEHTTQTAPNPSEQEKQAIFARVWKRVMAGDGQTGQGTAERKPAVAEEAWPGLSETVGTTEDGRDRSGTSGHGRS